MDRSRPSPAGAPCCARVSCRRSRFSFLAATGKPALRDSADCESNPRYKVQTYNICCLSDCTTVSDLANLSLAFQKDVTIASRGWRVPDRRRAIDTRACIRERPTHHAHLPWDRATGQRIGVVHVRMASESSATGAWSASAINSVVADGNRGR